MFREVMMISGYRVGVIDDDAILRSWYADALRIVGFDVWEAVDVRSATREFETHGADLLIVDLMLPPMRDVEGIAMCEFMRERHPEVKLVVLTNRAEADVLARARTVADAVFGKDSDVVVVIDRIKALLEGT